MIRLDDIRKISPKVKPYEFFHSSKFNFFNNDSSIKIKKPLNIHRAGNKILSGILTVEINFEIQSIKPPYVSKSFEHSV